jgi:hypothetical protein
LLALLLLGASPDAGQPLHLVQGVAQRRHVTRPCFSGVAMTEDMVQSDVAPLGNQLLTFTPGTVPGGAVFTRVKTNRVGRFQVRLPEGPWCVYFGEPPPPPPPDTAELADASDGGAASARVERPPELDANLDLDCLRRLRHPQPECDAVLRVPPRPLERTLERVTWAECPQPFAHPCYRGPMPP